MVLVRNAAVTMVQLEAKFKSSSTIPAMMIPCVIPCGTKRKDAKSSQVSS